LCAIYFKKLTILAFAKHLVLAIPFFEDGLFNKIFRWIAKLLMRIWRVRT